MCARDHPRQPRIGAGVVETWERLLRPVLVGVGDRWESTGQGVDVEHPLSETVIGLMRVISMSMPEARNPRPVLLACAEEEQHSLPLYVWPAALAERRIGARVLGARVPRDALAAAVRRSGPVVVFIWSQLAGTGSVDQLRDLPHLRPAPAVLVGGPGWATRTCPTASTPPTACSMPSSASRPPRPPDRPPAIAAPECGHRAIATAITCADDSSRGPARVEEAGEVT